MKILIVGDSFCNREHHKKVESWTRQLETMIPDCEVTCLGSGASSLFFAFQELKTQLETQEYDWYIFLFTHYTRFYMPLAPGISNLPHAQKLIAQYKSQILDTDLHNEEVWNKLCAAESYYEHLQQDSFDLFTFEAIVEKTAALLKGKNYIFFPCFDSFNDSTVAVDYMGHHPFTGQSIVQKENLNFKRRLDHQTGKAVWIENLELRFNHMTANNQNVFARYIYDLMTHGKSDITLKDIGIISGPFTKYYKLVTDSKFNFGH